MHIKNWTLAALISLLIGGPTFFASNAAQEDPAKRKETDSYGDPLPPGAIARLGTVRFRHGNGVSLIAFSADGKKLVFGGGEGVDNAISMVEASTGKELGRFGFEPGEKPCGVSLSPDGNVLAVASFNFIKPGGAVVVWDTTTGKELTRIDQGSKQPGDVVAFSPDGKVLVTQKYDRILNTNNYRTEMNAWDARTGKLLHEFKNLEGRVGRPAFSPDGKLLAFSVAPHDNNLEPTRGFFYDTATWRAVQPMAARLPGVRQHDREFLAWSPDGKLLVGGDSFNHVDFMKAETGELIDRERLQLVGASEATLVRALSFSHDGKMLAVVSLSGVVTIWEIGAARKVLYNLDGAHSVAVFSPTEPLLVTGGLPIDRYGAIPGRGYPALRFWDPTTGKEILKNDAPAAGVQMTHWLPGGKLLAVSPAENCYRLWDWREGRQIARVPFGGKYPWLSWSAVSPAGKLLLAVSQPSGQGNDETIELFDLMAGKAIHRLESKMVRLPIGFTADGRFLLAGVDSNLVAIWDTADGKLSRRLDLKNELHKGFARRAAISGDGKKLALEVSELLVEPSGPDPGGVMWPTGYYRCVIDLATGKKLWRTDRDDSQHPAVVSAFRFSPDGKILAERVGQTIHLRDSATGDLLRVLKCRNEWWEWAKQAEALAFTPDSKKLIAADLRSNIYVWDVATGKELQNFSGHRGRIYSVSVSSDGRTLATASEDSTVLIWRLDG